MLRFLDNSRFWQPHNAFLIVSLFFGVLACLFSPPLQGIDEFSHFFRIYQLSDFDLLCERRNNVIGEDIPKSLMETMSKVDGWAAWTPSRKVLASNVRAALQIPLRPDDKEFQRISAQFYTPVSYLPQLAAFWVLRLADTRPLVMMYIGRLAALIASTLLIYYAIKLSPMLKWFLALFALSPMVMFVRASLSADALGYSLSLLLLAYALKLATEPGGAVGKEQLLFLAGCGAALGLTKPPYFLLSACTAIIPPRKFGGHARMWAAVVFVVGASAAAVAGWWLLVRNLNQATGVGGAPVSASAQIRQVLADPWAFVSLVFRTYYNMVPSQLIYFTGPVFFHVVFDGSWHMPFTAAFLVLCTALALFDSRREVHFNAVQRLLSLGVFAAGLYLTAVLAYVLWNEVGSTLIRELYPRYLIPYAPLPFAVLYSRRLAALRPEKWLPALYYPAAIATCLLTELVLFGRWAIDV